MLQRFTEDVMDCGTNAKASDGFGRREGNVIFPLSVNYRSVYKKTDLF
jgi:hypothetical protein